MTDELLKLVELARSRKISGDDRTKQRISFAFGNGAEEASIVSKRSLKEADKVIRSQLGPKPR